MPQLNVILKKKLLLSLHTNYVSEKAQMCRSESKLGKVSLYSLHQAKEYTDIVDQFFFESCST